MKNIKSGKEQIAGINGQPSKQTEQCYYGQVADTVIVKFDTIRLIIPQEIIVLSKQKQSVLGLRYINYDTYKRAEVWEVSAKILKSNYSQLINKTNIQDLIGAINSSGILTIKSDKFLECVSIASADCAIDIKVESPSKVLNFLSTCIMSKFYYREPFEKNSVKETVLFKRKSKAKHSVCFYDKEKELLLPKNRQLLEYIDITQFKDVIRMEVRFKNLKEFRATFGHLPRYTQPMLFKLLNSAVNPYLIAFKKIINMPFYEMSCKVSHSSLLNLFMEFDKRNILKDFIFYYVLHQEFKGLIDDVLAFLKVYSKSVDRDKKKFKEYLPLILSLSGKTAKDTLYMLLRKLGENRENNI